MSKVARIISQIAGVVAVVAQIAFLVTGNPLFAAIAAVASAVSAISGAIAQATAKPPDRQGTVSQVMIGANMPLICAIGLTYVGGMLVYDDSANGPDNFDRSQIMVVSAAGPIEAFHDFYADYSPIGVSGSSAGLIGPGTAMGFYGADGGYMWVETRRGQRPETAHAGPAGRAALSHWGADYRLSGYASYRVTMEFDEDGVRYSSGVPQFGVKVAGVWAYDPRLDSTYPGGSGSQRWDNEASWAYSDNPALHALTYARGRFMNGQRILGAGFARESIQIADFVEFANVCTANGWTVGGAIYEGPGLSKWDNLKRICAAGAAEPVWSGGMLTLKLSAPKTPLFTIGRNELTDAEGSFQAQKSWRDRVNTVVPKVRLESHKWEYVQLEAVTSSTYLTEDGESKSVEVQYDLCQAKDQGAELAAYTLVNSREFTLTVAVKPAFMIYRPGEAGIVKMGELLDDPALPDRLCVITGRQVDPATGAVTLTLESETTAKHDFALGRTGVAPPTPVIVPPEDVDTAVGTPSTAEVTQLILNSSPRGLDLSIDTAGVVTISNHERVYSDKVVNVTGATVTPSPAAASPDKVGVFYDDPGRAGGAVTYQYDVITGGTGEIDHLFASTEHPYRHLVCLLPVPATGTGTGGSGTGDGTGGTQGPGGGYNPPHEN